MNNIITVSLHLLLKLHEEIAICGQHLTLTSRVDHPGGLDSKGRALLLLIA
jgi:hypothetical protein